MDKNPLEITDADIRSANNKRGRPVKAQTIEFSPQPKSAIIAQMLREKRLKDATEESSSNNWQSSSQKQYVSDYTVDDDYHLLEDEIKEIEIKVEVVCKPQIKRTKEKIDSVKRPKRLKVPKDKLEKPFPCDYPNCNYAAKLSCNLVKHKRIHTSEKPYICEHCPFRSNFINSLKVHRRIHTEEKPYNCEHCGYRCNTSSNLKKHRMHRHPEVAKI